MECTIEIDPKLRACAQEVLRYRLIGGEVKSDLRNTIAEVAFLKLYGNDALLDDFHTKNKRALNFIPQDDKGNLVRVSNRIQAPYRVYAKHLDADVYVFCSTSKDLKQCTFHGWLDKREVQEAPVFWFEQNGKRADYCHEIDKMFMYNMPEAFEFSRDCGHRFCIWDYLNRSWECSLCSKFCYDMDTRGRVDATVSG